MTDNDEDVLDINAFTKLIRATQDSSNFESYKTPFSYGPYLSTRQKRRHAQHQHKLALSAHGYQLLIARFLITNILERQTQVDPSLLSLLFLQPSLISPPTFEQSNSSLVKYTCAKTKLHQERLDAIHDLEKKIASK